MKYAIAHDYGGYEGWKFVKAGEEVDDLINDLL
jgi:hypothetical protein